MKAIPLWVLLASMMIAAGPALRGQVFTVANPAVNTPIPDGDSGGLTSTLNVNVGYHEIQSMIVTLNIGSTGNEFSPPWNGDLYVTLTHNDGVNTRTAVLVNRVGVDAGSDPYGYSDQGFAVTFSAAAPNDIHYYNNSSPTFDGSGRLTGTWQPDGRDIDPSSPQENFNTAPRTANLDSFAGMDPNGSWTLFVSDGFFQNEAQLEGWGMTIAAVPEPESYAIIFGCALLAAAISKRVRAATR